MEVEIKNPTDQSQVCVVFGQYDRAVNKSDVFEHGILNLKTGEGIQVIIDGDDSDEKRLELINKCYETPLDFKSMELSSSINQVPDFMRIVIKDANGDIDIKALNITNYFSAYQTEIYPIIIGMDWRIGQNLSIHIILRPKEEVKMKFKK